MSPPSQFCFAPFRLDPGNACLWHGVQMLALRPKAFAVLHYLVAHAGQLVTKDALLEAVWPDTTVSDAVLKVCIAEIRKVLGDTGRAPQCIATVHRRGYRFIAPVTTTEASVADHRSVPMVGRGMELAHCHTWLLQAWRGARQMVFVTGETGIGKTALVEAFLAQVTAEPHLWVTHGQCVEHYGVGEPYMPVLEALGRLCRGSEGERVQQLLWQYAPTWLAQMPWLLDPAARDSLQREIFGASQERMLRELAAAIEALTGGGAGHNPSLLVLWLEDLQWSDYATIDLLALVAQRREVARLLVIGTYRPVDLIVKGHPLRAVQQTLQLHGQCAELPLELLSEAAVARYLEMRFAGGTQEPLQKLAGIIHRRTDGNPLFMVNVVNSLVAQGVIILVDGGWELHEEFEALEVGVPETIRQMIAQQLERLPAREQELLEAASVVGVAFSTTAVAAALAEQAVRIEEQCEGLARRQQFLQPMGISEWPDGTVGARYEFIHALYQDVLYQRIAAARRLRLHRRIGECVERAYGNRAGEIATELARHFTQGREYRQAIQFLRQAAANAARRAAPYEALDALSHALDLVARLPEAEGPLLRLHLLHERGLVRHAQGEGVEDFTALAAYAQAQGQGGWAVKALCYLADELSIVDPEHGLATAAQAVELSRTLSDQRLSVLARGYYGYYHSLFRGWRYDDVQACTAAVEAARQIGDRGLLGLCLGRHAYFQCLRSDYRAACHTAEEGLQLTLEIGDVAEYLQCQFFQAWALLHLGEWGELLGLLQESLTIAEKNGHLPWVISFRFVLACLHEQAQDYTRVCALGEQGLQEAQEARFATGQLLSFLLLAWAHLGLEHYEQAFQYFGASLPLLEREQGSLNWPAQLLLRYRLSTYWLAQRELARARQEAERGSEIATQTGERTYLALSRRMLAEVALTQENWPQAEVEIVQALAVLEGAEVPLAAWRVYATAARVQQQLGRQAEAHAYWRRSAVVLRRLADTLGDNSALRQSLLAHPSVRPILRCAESV